MVGSVRTPTCHTLHDNRHLRYFLSHPRVLLLVFGDGEYDGGVVGWSAFFVGALEFLPVYPLPELFACDFDAVRDAQPLLEVTGWHGFGWYLCFKFCPCGGRIDVLGLGAADEAFGFLAPFLDHPCLAGGIGHVGVCCCVPVDPAEVLL